MPHPDGFTPLATSLRDATPGRAAVDVRADVAVRDDRVSAERLQPKPERDPAPPSLAQHVARELAMLRLVALESFDRLRDGLLERLAADVLGRELALAPADLAQLARRIVAERGAHDGAPVLVVSSRDAQRLDVPFPVRADATLADGDLVVEWRDGAVDAHFALRVRDALDDVCSQEHALDDVRARALGTGERGA